VLLVSDLFLHRAGIRRLLEAAGIRIVGEAAGSDEAVRFAVRERPDITLLDLDLRGDAFACVSEILTSAPNSRMIALSDQTRASDHLALVELGATGLVLKTEPPDTLIKAIQKVHGGEVWLPRTTTAHVLRRFAERRCVENVESAKIGTLSRREREIVTLVCEGLKNGAIAERLFVSEATIRNHLTSILAKLGVSDRFELAVYAFRNGLVQRQRGHAARVNAADR
jgi:DNA-binding NarL/FixJ family response regulator